MSRRTFAFAAALLLLLAPGVRAAAQDKGGKSLDQLLREVRQGRASDRAEERKREAEFKSQRDKQASMLAKSKAELSRLEAQSAALEKEFQENERELAALDEQLRNRLGSLGELFGVVRQVAGDTRAVIRGSLVSAELPGRAVPLDKLAESRKLPKVDELVGLWFALQQEATESGKTVRFQAPVVGSDGTSTQHEVVRIGPFTAIDEDGEFLQYTDGSLRQLLRQPTGAVASAADDFDEATAGVEVAPIDPSKGQILALEVQRPSAKEEVQAGGIVGYVIIVLGVLGALIAVWRFFALMSTGSAMKAEKPDSPLGRVLSIYEQNPAADTETLELKLDEAVMREVPKLESGLNVIRVLSVIAPLLGLLGTVTGMIKTFQMITLFGTGDPKLMAGGISEALVTTMLGLIVAIPLTFLHSILRDRSKGLIEVLEEQSAGMVARRAEAQSV